MSNKIQVHLKLTEASNIQDSIKEANHNGYAGILIPTVNQLYKREFIDEELGANHENFTRSPLVLNCTGWSYVSPLVTPLNLSAADSEIALNNRKQFVQEMEFAYHVKGNGQIIVRLGNNDPVLMGKLLKQFFPKSDKKIEIFVEIPMVNHKVLAADHLNDVDEEYQGPDQWKIWHKLHEAAEFSKYIKLALVFCADLPSEYEIKRWLGESIGMLMIPQNCFKQNASNYAAMTQAHWKTVVKFMQHTHCKLAIVPTLSKSRFQRIKQYVDYIQHISKNVETNESTHSEEVLQVPLQPLRDNLDSGTYETFEADPVKYVRYQEAIQKALFALVPEEERKTRTAVILIVGAGRGPLIRATINAGKNTGRKVRIFVVEKNPNAIVTLTNLIEELWALEDITLIKKDMRDVELKEKADMVVSELLGSFADNELSPECLDGAQKLLKPNGISIPCDSVSYLRPIMSKQAVSNVNGFSDIFPEHMNFLSYMMNVFYIDDTKEAWKFEHPNLEWVIDNRRFACLTFTTKIDCVLHGFHGYFTSKLFEDVQISIHPESFSKGMGSWFPAYFPTITTPPIYLKKDESFKVRMWRKIDPKDKVWYEWEVELSDGTKSPIFNPDGQYHPIHLTTEFHNLNLDD